MALEMEGKTERKTKKLEDYVRSIPDFPEPGIIFRDVTSILQDADGFQLAIDSLMDLLKDVDADVIVGAESVSYTHLTLPTMAVV